MRLILAVVAGLVLALPASATPFPNFDSAAFCAKVGYVGMTHSTVALDGCITSEVAARTELAEAWDGLSANEQGHCLTAATFAGDGSYALMQSCLARVRADAALGN
jgi:hypothetical protein